MSCSSRAAAQLSRRYNCQILTCTPRSPSRRHVWLKQSTGPAANTHVMQQISNLVDTVHIRIRGPTIHQKLTIQPVRPVLARELQPSFAHVERVAYDGGRGRAQTGAYHGQRKRQGRLRLRRPCGAPIPHGTIGYRQQLTPTMPARSGTAAGPAAAARLVIVCYSREALQQHRQHSCRYM